MSDPLDTIPTDKREEARRLDAIFRNASGFAPVAWGRMIGYGRYHYRYTSGREGDFLATGFSMRARDISLHILPGYSEFPDIAARLGPHSRGKSCWYIKSLDSIDARALADLIRAGLADLATHWPVEPT